MDCTHRRTRFRVRPPPARWFACAARRHRSDVGRRTNDTFSGFIFLTLQLFVSSLSLHGISLLAIICIESDFNARQARACRALKSLSIQILGLSSAVHSNITDCYQVCGTYKSVYKLSCERHVEFCVRLATMPRRRPIIVHGFELGRCPT